MALTKREAKEWRSLQGKSKRHGDNGCPYQSEKTEVNRWQTKY